MSDAGIVGDLAARRVLDGVLGDIKAKRTASGEAHSRLL
jgi:hypothetical protein